MLFQHKDGELRIFEKGGGAGGGPSGTTYYVEILFIDANLSGPISRAQTEERLILDRGVLDSNAHYVESGDAARMEPLPLTFSCKAADTSHSQALIQLLSGATILTVGGTTYPMRTRSVSGVTPYGYSRGFPVFKDTVYKITYKVEVLYSGSSNWGFSWDEAYFTPSEQTVSEAEDSLTLNMNAMVYGGVTRIAAFTSGASVSAVAA